MLKKKERILYRKRTVASITYIWMIFGSFALLQVLLELLLHVQLNAFNAEELVVSIIVLIGGQFVKLQRAVSFLLIIAIAVEIGLGIYHNPISCIDGALFPIVTGYTAWKAMVFAMYVRR